MCRIPGLHSFISSGSWVTNIFMILTLLFLYPACHLTPSEYCPLSHASRIQLPTHGKVIPKKASRDERRQRMVTTWGRPTCASIHLPWETTKDSEIQACKIMKRAQLRRTVCFCCHYKRKTKIKDANSKLTEWNASLHGAWAHKLWACVGWQSTWGKCRATFAFFLCISLSAHFWSLLAARLWAASAFGWSWHECFLALCRVGAHLLSVSALHHQTLSIDLLPHLLPGWGSRREIWVESVLVPGSCPWQICIAAGLRSAASLIATGVHCYQLFSPCLAVVCQGGCPSFQQRGFMLQIKPFWKEMVLKATALLSPPSLAEQSPATSPLLCHSSYSTVSWLRDSVSQKLFCALWGYGS